MSTVLEVEGIAKAFGGVQAVKDVSFRVSAGEMLALIGPNGAGKDHLLQHAERADRAGPRRGAADG